MVAMYEKYGYYKDTVKSIGLKGIEGLAKIQEIMENFRQEPPKTLGDYTVTAARDYKAGTIMDMASGAVRPTGLPSANVLYYEMNDGAWLCVRPSGTEPKIKFYYGVKGTSMELSLIHICFELMEACLRKIKDPVADLHHQIFDFAETGFHEFETAKLYQQDVYKRQP